MTDPVGSRRFLGIGLLVAALTAYPPLSALWMDGTLGVFKYLAPDAFYYLAIADHSQALPHFSFDGLHATNGFHPLWQLVLSAAFGWLGSDQSAQLYFAMGSSIVLVSIGTGFLGATVFRLTGRGALAVLALVPGLFYLAAPDFGPQFAAQWAFANGMESPLTVFFFGVLCWWMLAGRGRDEAWTGRRLWLLSLLSTALILSRLDDVFLLVPVAAAVWLQGETPPRRRADLLRVVTIPGSVLVAYMAYNFVVAGSPLPSSGLAKAQPLWALLRNSYSTFTTLFPFLDFLRGPISNWDSEAWRILQILVPAGVATVWLLQVFGPRGTRGREVEPWRRNLGLLAAYVVLKAAYNFSVVGLWHHGWWYYTASIMTTNLIISVWLGDLFERASSHPEDREASVFARFAPQWAMLAVVAAIVVMANQYAFVKRSGGYHAPSYTFWQEREVVRDLIASECGDCGVLAFDDGIVSYSLGEISTLNGLGLTMDAEARAALDSGQLLDLAWQRGHRLFVSVNYPMPDDSWSSMAKLRLELGRNVHFEGVDLGRWDFDLVFRTPEGGVPFVRFTPASAAGEGGYSR